jgi:hypothetical protein
MLDCDPVEYLLNSCSLLSTLSMERVVVDQDGLDLLLAHPHITDVTLMAVSATESRVDSPCAWRALRLAGQVHLGTVAYVPLHSLQEPLRVEALLLPLDTMGIDLMLAATTRMAQHSHLFKLQDPCELIITDAVWELPSGKLKRHGRWRGEEELCKSKGLLHFSMRSQEVSWHVGMVNTEIACCQHAMHRACSTYSHNQGHA